MNRWIVIPLSAILLVTVILSGIFFWFHNRPRPDDLQTTLFQGIEYTRQVIDEPRPYIVHIVRVDLSASGIGFYVTPPADELDEDVSARTTSQFLTEFDLQLAVNADFFDPWWSNVPWDYYPHVGDGVNTRGLSASQGDIYSRGYVPASAYSTLYISQDNRVSIDSPIGEVYNAISGYLQLVRNGEIRRFRGNDSYITSPHPRTAIGISEDSNTLIIVLVDGRQPNYSEGVTIPELARILLENGAYNAINFDGGGSVTLVIADENGDSQVLNSPIDQHIPGRERPIANHLGIYAVSITE